MVGTEVSQYVREQLDAMKLEVEGEMHADAALSPFIREEIFPHSKLTGRANLLIMPTLDAANISLELLRVATNSIKLGPMLLGAARPVHIVTPSATVRNLLNMSAIAVVDSIRESAEIDLAAE